MRRNAQRQDDAPSYDSFLDIVANLVGILVILIMVIGVRAEDAWSERSVSADQASDEAPELPDVEAPRAVVASIRAELGAVNGQIEQVESRINQELTERDRLFQQIATASQEGQRNQQHLQATQTRQAQLSRIITSAQIELDHLARRQREIERSVEEPIIIQHHPTPLAKTVFGREDHFRLLSGRLAHVPLTELTGQLTSEAKLKVWKLKNAPRITETVGPFEGFHMKYTLVRREFTMQTSGLVRRSGVELDRFVLVPLSDDLGQPLEIALQAGSAFNRRLDGLDSHTTTITVWTYPDSYPDFRRLKEYLQQRGFLTAARPMPDGHPIGGSPHGSKSAAQ